MIEAAFEYSFIRYALISGLIVGFIAPLIGTFIVVRRLSLIADALSHISLGGIAFGMYLTSITSISILTPINMGIVFCVIGALLIEKLRTLYKAFEDLAIPIIMSLGIGLSVVFISLADGFNQDLFGYLFGSISAVTWSDMIFIIIVLLIVIIFITLFFKELFLLSFDHEYSRVVNIPQWIHTLFMLVVAIVIVASMRIVGTLLVSALITIPVAIGLRVTKGFKQLMIVSIIVGEIGVMIGMLTAFYLDISPGGTIVLTLILMLLFTFLWNMIQKRGVTRASRSSN
mgnify:FL=1